MGLATPLQEVGTTLSARPTPPLPDSPFSRCPPLRALASPHHGYPSVMPLLIPYQPRNHMHELAREMCNRQTPIGALPSPCSLPDAHNPGNRARCWSGHCFLLNETRGCICSTDPNKTGSSQSALELASCFLVFTWRYQVSVHVSAEMYYKMVISILYLIAKFCD
ncbi:hypothetical protein H112_01237 [Trichophyton rubrum D6]|uniref:Uncharacterized protein n=3 Tax=Trichophyton TaxID=5550 RepID=A0A080WPH1_TRIRC|nr:uncharacterized protein TERG_12575 [Trichophyton rubrum CBS 118892]EZF26701.1 hypothetical protein H100_01230 [Trichophyton rubrum MR850]EZF45678.1 hypothetical protein H102_01227 [Trichophyton rubrum CBS 100081]EZF56381.1 hypothetical protein H103_01234 [Trichophyton rubrum CBS 288.86]EZF66964.1 hypothetical protein H104_01220 [Trichophyton rubrum CBS 289.86]EZF77603.1 hypothetical protein H105_01240 [Trichophyton soudanense CBS 452.61]EZF88309.1 hypothetical protein H110_01237 [Trichophy